MRYWTMQQDEMYPAVTLCEDCALEATNIAAGLMGLGPWDSMDAAALELETIISVFGSASGSRTFGFFTSDDGDCEEQCEHTKGLRA